MSPAAQRHHARAFVALIAGAAAALISSQVLFNPFSGGPNLAWAQANEHDGQTVPRPALPTPTPTPKPTVFETGIASTYGEGDGFEGNLTACGQVFHTNVVQVAHKSLPCGTLIRVEDSDTGHSVTARVTDRGPYIPGRVVDLSWGAFQQLDPSGPGLLNVNVYVLDQ
jgi:rare lipoprotein A (peptidoglycan hydrolase)